MNILSRLITPTGTKGCASHVALEAPFVPVGVTNRDKMVFFVPVVLVWRSRLGNRDNKGFPTRTNLMLCSSDETHHADQMGLRFA